MALTRLVFFLLLTIITFSSAASSFSFSLYNRSSSVPNAAHPSFNSAAVVAGSPCNGQEPAAALFASAAAPSSLKLHLKHPQRVNSSRKHAFLSSAHKDGLRIQTLFGRIAKKATSGGNRHGHGRGVDDAIKPAAGELAGKKLMATLESGVSLGSGEYFMDVFVGTPPKHFSLILDTGSDLNWLQCSPCHDCFDQHGPLYDPNLSSTYRNLSCDDARCGLVSSPDTTRPCRRGGGGEGGAAAADTCPYFYWYGDQSNTTGDLAVEAFTVNLTGSGGGGGGPESSHRVEGVVFGCGHWNRGLFHGAAGLLGLGRGPLSFASQLRSLYGHTFSYCLVDRNSDLSVSSKLIFGEDQSLLSHPDLNYTSFAAGRDDPDDTFYYVHVRGIRVGGELLAIAQESWELAKDGAAGGGTIIDSGTTLSYFVDPAYRVIRDAFLEKVKYPVLEDFPVLNPCYNVSGVEDVQMPGFSVEFADGAVWDFPVDNYFIRLEPEGIMCLAILGTPRSSLSIIGNYQQQNFHILYDTSKSRLGFAPTRCAEV
ncbi:aspartic proteinase nepenthesin-2-like precursor [Iris pallida]|uniref:Aspartic proteinase nepenthesin-2-like n=1 Tax=Iris pallida TaxID=29817 RepID=A0AAX6G8C6_IRIPA|nr:aspartic proteinase nepenthesin-2-like precursor [Iris pallida]